MSRAKGRRPGTRGGTSKVLPEDLPDAAEAALDDLIRANASIDDDEPATYSRAVSEARIVDHRSTEDDEPATVAGRRTDDTAAVTGKRRLPPPVAPLTSSTPPPRTVTYGPLPSDSPLPLPTSRSTPLPSGSPLSSPLAALPKRPNTPPERHTPSGRLSLPLPPMDTGAVPIVRPAAGSVLDLDPNAIDTNAVPLIDTGLVPLADDDDVDDLGMGSQALAGEDVDLGSEDDGDLAMTADGRLAEPDMSEVLEALERTTSSRAESMVTVDRSRGESRRRPGRSLDEPTTRPVRSNSYDDFAMPRAVSAPYDDIAVGRRATAAQVEDDQLVEERAIIEVPALRFAIFEESAHLGSAQSAVAAAGHAVAVAGTGRDGIARVLDEILEGEIDAVLAAMPGGEPILAAIAALADRPVVVASYGSSIPDAIQGAIAAGADLATARPHDLERLAPILLAASRLQLERRVARATRGAQSDDDARSFLALDAFQRMLDLEITRARRFEYALSVALFAVEVDLPSPPPGIRGILRARAGNGLIGAIRDIDLATQVEPSGTGAGSVQAGNERFLVLLPYTDLKGAAAVARRVIAAVSALDPVNAAGRKFAPRVVGAIAGMRAGEPATFDKLVKDATRTLEQARRDGAELAVQP